MGLLSKLFGIDKVGIEVAQNSEKIAELIQASKLSDAELLKVLQEFKEVSGATQEQIEALKKGLEELSGDSDKIQELSAQIAEMTNSDTMMIVGIAVAGSAVAIMAGFIAFCIYQGVKQEREAKKESELPDQEESQSLIDLSKAEAPNAKLSRFDFETNATKLERSQSIPDMNFHGTTEENILKKSKSLSDISEVKPDPSFIPIKTNKVTNQGALTVER